MVSTQEPLLTLSINNASRFV